MYNFMHKCTLTLAHKDTDTCACVYTDTCACMYTPPSPTHRHTNSHTHTHTLTHAHNLTHTHTHTISTHTHTHTHTHTFQTCMHPTSQALLSRTLPANSAMISYGYATKGVLLIAAHLSTNAASAHRKVWVLIRLEATSKHACKYEACLPQVQNELCLN